MHLWFNPSITRSSKLWNINKIKAFRPKDISDEDWKEYTRSLTLEKLRVLNKLTKADIKSEELANKKVSKKG